MSWLNSPMVAIILSKSTFPICAYASSVARQITMNFIAVSLYRVGPVRTLSPMGRTANTRDRHERKIFRKNLDGGKRRRSGEVRASTAQRHQVLDHRVRQGTAVTADFSQIPLLHGCVALGAELPLTARAVDLAELPDRLVDLRGPRRRPGGGQRLIEHRPGVVGGHREPGRHDPRVLGIPRRDEGPVGR